MFLITMDLAALLKPAGRAEVFPKYSFSEFNTIAKVSPGVACRACGRSQARGQRLQEDQLAKESGASLNTHPMLVASYFLKCVLGGATSKPMFGGAAAADSTAGAISTVKCTSSDTASTKSICRVTFDGFAPVESMPFARSISVKDICGDATVAGGFPSFAQTSRRNLLRGALWATSMCYGSGPISCASAYTVNQVKPDEKETYAEAQSASGPLRVLWIGSGTMKGVYRNLFLPDSEVIALDLLNPDTTDLSAAITYATEHGYQLRFEQGDATHLKYRDEAFDVVVSSMFLCQGSEQSRISTTGWQEVVVSEIRRVLKPGGRFGFYEHVEDIDKVIVEKVFGERSVIRVQAYPERTNVIAGVVRKI
jgi:SAM-dependent methyltransferase